MSCQDNDDNPDGITIVNQAVSSHLLRKRLEKFSGTPSLTSENVSLLSEVIMNFDRNF